MSEQVELYKIVDDFQKTLAESGFSPEKSIDPIKEIQLINSKIKSINYILVAVVIVVVIAFVGIVIDTIFFHIENSKYSSAIYDFRQNITKEVEMVQRDIEKLKLNNPSLFR